MNGKRYSAHSAPLRNVGVLLEARAVHPVPLNGLDPDGIHWMRGLLKTLAAEGRTVSTVLSM